MMDTKLKQKLKRFINELASVRGRHTELVSVYIPAGYDINKIINHLQQEQSTAQNIKDKTTRNNVIDSLERMIRHLRLYKKTPKNGLAVFAGNVSKSDNKINIQVWSIEPPEPIQTRLYRCDQEFVLDLLRDMLETKEVYGLIVIDRREGNLGLLKGSSVTELAKFTSGVPGKTKAGGQSQMRFARIREIAAKEFYARVGNAANKEFLDMKELKGMIIGGPGPTKEEFLEGSYLNNELKKKVIGLKDLSYTGEFGLQELVDKSHDILHEQEITKEKNLMKRFFTLLSTDPKKVAYSLENVKKALDLAAVEVLLISENLDEETAKELEDLAENTGANFEYISTETREGNQLKEIGGIAAILRFRIS